MPKMKSHKASKMRLRLTSTGKIKRTQCGVRHLLAGRSPKRMRNLHKMTITTTAGYTKRVRIALLKGQSRKRLHKGPPPGDKAAE
jgi:large subunit ribosomal protein L35